MWLCAREKEREKGKGRKAERKRVSERERERERESDGESGWWIARAHRRLNCERGRRRVNRRIPLCRSIRTPISPPGRAITAYREWDEIEPKRGGTGVVGRWRYRGTEARGGGRGWRGSPDHHQPRCRQLCVVDRPASGENLLLRAENQRERFPRGNTERQSYGLNASW